VASRLPTSISAGTTQFWPASKTRRSPHDHIGKDGKPLYVFGPYDNPRSVIRTLKRTVGRGNFEVVAIAG